MAAIHRNPPQTTRSLRGAAAPIVGIGTTADLPLKPRRRAVNAMSDSLARPAIHVGSILSNNKLVRRVEPIYPKPARRMKVEGIVILEALINREGKVDHLRVVSGHPLLLVAALQAVSQWEYEPHAFRGEIVPIWTTIALNFSLRR